MSIARHTLASLDLAQLAQADRPEGWLAGFELSHWPKGSLLSTPGGSPDRTLLVKTGRLRVYLAGASRDLSLAFLEPGDLFTTHTPTYVETVVSSSLWMMDTRRFAQRLATDPSATPAMMRVLGRLLRNAVSLIEDLAFREVPARLARFLVGLARRRGQAQEEGWLVPLDLGMEDIASLLGSTRQTVSALMNQWEREGLLRRHGRHQWWLRSLAELDALADLSELSR